MEAAETIYKLVKDVSTLTSGDQIFISSTKDGSGKLLSITQNKNNRGETDVSVSNERIGTIPATAQAIILEKIVSETDAKDVKYAFNVGTIDTPKYLYAASNSKNYLRTQDINNDNGKFTISISDTNGVATIRAQGGNSHNLLQYNSSSKIFSCYASSQQNIYLFKTSQLYTVSFDLNGGELSGGTSEIAPKKVENGSTFESPGILTHSSNSDKKFVGWYYTDSNDISKEWNFATDTVTSDLTLSAKWGYEVTINPNNGSVIGEPTTVLEGTQISTLVPTEKPERNGFEFAGWKKVIGTETSNITNADLVASKLEIRADWTEVATPLVFVETENKINNDVVEYYVDQEFTLSAVIQNATALSYTWEIEDDLTDPVLANVSGSLNTKDIKFMAKKIGDVYISISVSISESSEPISHELIVSITHPVKDIATSAWLGISYNNIRKSNTIYLDVSKGSFTGTISDSEDLKSLLTDDTKLTATYKKNANTYAYINKTEARLYPYSGDGSSIEIARKDTSSIIKKVIVTFTKTDSGKCGISVDGGKSYTDCESDTPYTFENATSLSIKNITSATSKNQIKLTKVAIELESEDVEFTSIRARFGITIPKDTYQFDSIKSANVSFKVNIAGSEKIQTVTMTDANKTMNDDGSITYVVSVVNIPLANCKDVIHVVPTITINGHSYELAGTAYSVYQMVDAYLAQDAFKDNAYLTALKASIDAATNVA